MVVAAVAISAVLGLSGYIALQLPIIAGGARRRRRVARKPAGDEPTDRQCHGRSRRRLCRRARGGQSRSRGHAGQPPGRQHAAHTLAGDYGRVSNSRRIRRQRITGASERCGDDYSSFALSHRQLGGCAIWSKGPPSCDGLARRPLNRSLWDWEIRGAVGNTGAASSAIRTSHPQG